MKLPTDVPDELHADLMAAQDIKTVSAEQDALIQTV